MRRADRLFQIVQHLRGGRLVTASQLAEWLEVTPRTIYRDVADLMGSGVPIEGEAGVGYVMRGGYDIPPLMFTNAEIVALVAGARLIKAWGGLNMSEAAEEALVKIESVLPASAREKANAVRIHALGMGELTDAVRGLLDMVETASHDKRLVHFSYNDKAEKRTTRTVRPLGLWYWGKVWTMIGWCEMRDDFRMFRVDRITDFTLGEGFKERKGQTLRDFYLTEPAHKSPLPRD